MHSKKMPEPGRFPLVSTSLRARVLLVLLSEDDMTGVESLFEHRKITLNTVVRALVRKYGWPVERRDFPTNLADGRAAWASVYSLAPEVVAAAMGAGGEEWVEAMHALAGARRAGRTRS
ncbi:MAG: hypothetical protein ACJ8HI_16240 [Massilia sp.]